MRRIFYYSLDLPPEHKDDCARAMRRLSDYLALPPLQVQYSFEELPADLESDVRESIETAESFSSCSASIADYFFVELGDLANLIVLCNLDSRLKKLSLKSNRDALWGGTAGCLAAVYQLDNEYILWHEALHMLGAEDCYDMSVGLRGPNCGLPNCIMQYEATKSNVGDWPFLCNENINRIKKMLQLWQKQNN